MPSLILEGGTLRPIFSAGVMDALLDNNITFPYCIGVSAGITNGVSYISKQKGRNLEVVTKYRNDNRYLSYRNFLRCKSIFGLDFVFDEILKTLKITSFNPAIIFNPNTFCITINPIKNEILKNISFNIISTLPFLNLSIRNLIIPNTPKKIKYNNDMLILTKKNEIRLDAK